MNYFIGKFQFSQVEIIKLAFDFGWISPDKRVVDASVALLDAISFLGKKCVKITQSLNSPLTEKEIEKNTIEINKVIPQPVSLNPSNDKSMICFVDNFIYEIDTNYIGLECWDVQMFGLSGCVGCPDKNKIACYGGVSLTSAYNSLGHKLPIAKKIGERPKREKYSSRKGD